MATAPAEFRELPQNLQAERIVIGSLLLAPDVCDEVSLLVRPEDFHDQANAEIYRRMLDLHDDGKQLEPELLLEHLRRADTLHRVGGAAYLAEVASSVRTAAHAEHYADIVREKAIVRQLIDACREITKESFDQQQDARHILSIAEERIFGILEERGGSGVSSIREVLQDSLTRISARMDHEHALGGLDTGFDDFDEMTGGLHDSELIILAARPSMGKTALALNIVEHIAFETQRTAMFVSLEMSAIELGDRLLCSASRVNGSRLRNGTITNDERRKLVQKASEMSKAPLFIDDSPSRTMTEIAATARRLKRREDLSLVVIDYLQLIEPDNPRDPRQEQVSKIARRLKRLARELEVPVICLSQLNRQAESTKDNRPRLSHLRESGAIEQDADVVMFIHREEYYQTTEEDRRRVEGEAELIVQKQRNGPTGDVKLTWLHEYTRFVNAAPQQYDDLAAYSGDYE